MVTVLFLGATGYIGGSVLVALTKAYPGVTIKALIRPSKYQSEPIFDAIKALGAEPVCGSLKDYALVASLAYESDIVVNVADSDDVLLLKAILESFKKRKEEKKSVGSIIQTSGTMIFLDGNTEGRFDPQTKIWTDNEEDIRQLATSMYHGEVDVPLMKASEDGYVNSFIICPSGVFGLGEGPDRTVASFFPSTFLQMGGAFYVGEGSSIFGTVHIQDLTSLYLLIFDRALSAATEGRLLTTSPYSRYYIASTGEMDTKSIARAFARKLYSGGIIPSAEPKSVAYEEAGVYKAAWGNMRLKPENAKSIGWEPKYPVDDETLVEGIWDCVDRYKPLA